MTWFKVDDNLADHPKVRRLGRDKLPAMGLWTLAGTHAGRYETDGFVPDEIVERHDPKHRLARRLVAVGLWARDGDDGETGYRFHDWPDWQPTRAQLVKERATTRERQRRHRLRRDATGVRPGSTDTENVEQLCSTDPGHGVGHGVTNAFGDASLTPLVTVPPTRPGPTRPDPSPSGGSVRGEGSDPQRARTTHPHHRCPRHRDLPADDPGPDCVRCRAARLAAERAASDAADAEQRRAAARVEAARDALDACHRCDEQGWLLDHDGTPTEPARRCDHTTEALHATAH